jgi:hypothetical protein
LRFVDATVVPLRLPEIALCQRITSACSARVMDKFVLGLGHRRVADLRR